MEMDIKAVLAQMRYTHRMQTANLIKQCREMEQLEKYLISETDIKEDIVSLSQAAALAEKEDISQ